MKKPMDRGAAINALRIRRWLLDFSGYRTSVTRGSIETWLEQFSPRDKDLAARILDAIHFVGNASMMSCFRDLLNSVEGWNIDRTLRQGRWFFVPFSGSAGESGDSMMHVFRQATAMTKREFNDLFVYRSDLVSKKPGAEDTVVLLDDFSGTGNQACRSWNDVFEELLTGGPRVILMLVAATRNALHRISKETEMEPFRCIELSKRDNIFDRECVHFTETEKNILLKYCRRADSKNPKGYGSTGLLLVLAHRCPNNTIPILHATHGGWDGLFPRFD